MSGSQSQRIEASFTAGREAPPRQCRIAPDNARTEKAAQEGKSTRAAGEQDSQSSPSGLISPPALQDLTRKLTENYFVDSPLFANVGQLPLLEEPVSGHGSLDPRLQPGAQSTVPPVILDLLSCA